MSIELQETQSDVLIVAQNSQYCSVNLGEKTEKVVALNASAEECRVTLKKTEEQHILKETEQAKQVKISEDMIVQLKEKLSQLDAAIQSSNCSLLKSKSTNANFSNKTVKNIVETTKSVTGMRKNISLPVLNKL